MRAKAETSNVQAYRALVSLLVTATFSVPAWAEPCASEPAKGMSQSSSPDAEGCANTREDASPEAPENLKSFIKKNARPIFISVGFIGLAVVFHKKFRGGSGDLPAPPVDPGSPPPAPLPIAPPPPMPILPGGMTAAVREPVPVSTPNPEPPAPRTLRRRESPKASATPEPPRDPKPPVAGDSGTEEELPVKRSPMRFRGKIIRVEHPFTREPIEALVEHLIVPTHALPPATHFTEYDGARFFFMHNPRPDSFEHPLTLGIVVDDALGVFAYYESFFETHRFDPRLTQIEEPFEALFPQGVPTKASQIGVAF